MLPASGKRNAVSARIRAHVIVNRYERAIVVWERHESGRIHFHLVVVLEDDVRTGADFAAFKCKDYRSANRALRAEWAFWREHLPKIPLWTA